MTIRNRRNLGFTLLEVMVAVAILAIGLTAIFSSEAGAVKAAHRARKMNVAALLARCKMAEIEEQIGTDGLPAVDDRGRDECCEDAEIEGYSCEWSVERIVLPDDMGLGEEEGADSLSALAGGGEEDQSATLDSMLGGGGDADGIASMAMSFAFPILKPSIEDQVRRAKVTVQWQEGGTPRDFDVVQYVVAEQPAAGTGEQADEDGS